MDKIDTDKTGILDKQKTITIIIIILTNQFIEHSKFSTKTPHFFEHLNLNIHKYYILKSVLYCNKKGHLVKSVLAV